MSNYSQINDFAARLGQNRVLNEPIRFEGIVTFVIKIIIIIIIIIIVFIIIIITVTIKVIIVITFLYA